MQEDPRLAEIAALVGDPARANILTALLDGRALTAGELAYFAGVSPQTTSGHLAKLTESRLLALQKQGRHRYYRLATPQVGRMIEGIMEVAVAAPARYRPASKADAALRQARTCYDHFAGKLGVGLADALAANGHLVLGEDAGEVTEAGLDFLGGFGLDLAAARQRRRATAPLRRPMPRCVRRAPATTISRGASASASPMRSPRRAISCSARRRAR